MQIPLRASGSSEIFPGTPRRPDQTQSHYWPYGQQRGKTTDWRVCYRRKNRREGGGEKKKRGRWRERQRRHIYNLDTHTHTPQPRGESKLQSALQDRGGSQAPERRAAAAGKSEGCERLRMNAVRRERRVQFRARRLVSRRKCFGSWHEE